MHITTTYMLHNSMMRIKSAVIQLSPITLLNSWNLPNIFWFWQSVQIIYNSIPTIEKCQFADFFPFKLGFFRFEPYVLQTTVLTWGCFRWANLIFQTKVTVISEPNYVYRLACSCADRGLTDIMSAWCCSWMTSSAAFYLGYALAVGALNWLKIACKKKSEGHTIWAWSHVFGRGGQANLSALPSTSIKWDGGAHKCTSYDLLSTSKWSKKYLWKAYLHFLKNLVLQD